MMRLTLLLLCICAFVTVSLTAPIPDEDTALLEDTAALVEDVTLPEDATTLSEDTMTGRGTYFYVGLGACGEYNKNSDHIVALSPEEYGSSDEVSSHCGQYVHITNLDNGESVYAMVRDECPGCSGGDLDMSPSAFSTIGPESQGVLRIQWYYKAKGWEP